VRKTSAPETGASGVVADPNGGDGVGPLPGKPRDRASLAAVEQLNMLSNGPASAMLPGARKQSAQMVGASLAMKLRTSSKSKEDSLAAAQAAAAESAAIAQANALSDAQARWAAQTCVVLESLQGLMLDRLGLSGDALQNRRPSQPVHLRSDACRELNLRLTERPGSPPDRLDPDDASKADLRVLRNSWASSVPEFRPGGGRAARPPAETAREECKTREDMKTRAKTYAARQAATAQPRSHVAHAPARHHKSGR